MSETLGKREKKAHVWTREKTDWYAESDWIWSRLFQQEPFIGHIHDPSCGRGNVVRSARDAGYEASGSDIVPASMRGNPEDYPVEDFMQMPEDTRLANICTNPPFNLCGGKVPEHCYVRKALSVTTGKVALILPTAWVNARRWLRQTPLYRVWWITPRPSMPPGHVIMAGEKPGSGTTDFAVYVFMQGFDGAPTMNWLCRDEAKP